MVTFVDSEEKKAELNETMVEEEQELIQARQQIKKPELKWIPLESNPDLLNKMIHANGVDATWSFVDILGLDEESVSLIPQPAVAIIFLFPGTENYETFRETQEAHLKMHEQNISPNLMYFKQYIGNACGMMALLHSLSNNDHLVGPGLFQTIIKDTRSMSPEERGEYLETCQELAAIHDFSARHDAQSMTPKMDDPCTNHFICYVTVDEHLYELDGSRAFPINHGKSTNFIQDAVKLMRQAVERDPDEKDYSALAFTKTPSSVVAK